MQRKIILERDLTDSHCCFLNEDGIRIIDTSRKYFAEETIAYGSYRAEMYTNGFYVGRSRNIVLWGPCHLGQTEDMDLIMEFRR